MAAIDDLIEHYRSLRAQMLADIATWKERGMRMHINNEDVTENMLLEEQRRADELARIIALYEKRP